MDGKEKKKNGSLLIRDAALEDAASILNIYSPYIIDTSITFETEIPSVDDFRSRIASVTSMYPWFVAESNGVVAGYAYASRHKERAAYRWCVDFAIYISPSFQGKGLGSLLYGELIGVVKALGYYNAFGIISLPNEASVRLHESYGFVKTAHIRSAGYKRGSWHDIGHWQLRLREEESEPAEPLPYINFKKSE